MVSIHCGEFHYTAVMVSLHFGDGFIPTLGWFYPNSGRVFFFQLWGVFFSKVFFQPKVGFFPTQGRFFSSIRMIFLERGDAIFRAWGCYFPSMGMLFF